MTDTPHQQQIAQGIEFLRKKDKKLAAVIKRVGPLNYRSQRTGFAALVKIIVGQQLSGTVAEAIYKKLCRKAGGSRVSLAAVRRLDDAALRSAGLSNAKVRAVRDLVDKIDSGLLTIRNFNRMTDDEIAAAITQVKGLGPWSAQMYLMFVLQRLDVFAVGDLGIQKALSNLYGLDRKSADFESFGDRWKPYRTIACWYLWASTDNSAK
jgi:DNA-3-methyladenine glycosylase II